MVGLGSNDSLRGIFSTIFQEHFSLTTTQLGLIVTASYIGNLVFLLVGGNLSTRFSKKRVLQVLILIWMVALALFAFTKMCIRDRYSGFDNYGKLTMQEK